MVTEMKERYILLKDFEVNAILKGRKKQLRGIVKGLDPDRLSETMTNTQWRMVNRRKPQSFGINYFCPFGQPGERLWVKETFVLEDGGFEYLTEIPKDGRPHKDFFNNPYDKQEVTNRQVPHYAATEDPCIVPWDCLEGECEHKKCQEDGPTDRTRWSPSMLMPRWASRIDLEIVKLRTERLQDISREDAWAEGIGQTFGDFMGNAPAWAGEPHEYDNRTSIENFRELWKQINGADSWNSNPLVWVVDFKRMRP